MIRVAALAAALLLASCGPRPIDARPALWVVRDADTEIWLLGTIHALPPEVRWETPAIERAMARADTLVTEIPAGDPDAAAATFQRFAAARGLPPLAERVPPAERAALREAVAASGVPAATSDGMRSWAAAVTLAAGDLRARGASASYGVEAVLFKRLPSKRRIAFETQAEQLQLFSALPEPVQRRMLSDAVAKQGSYAATLNSWARGDTRALAAAVNGADDTLLVRRNRRWAGWIAARMARPGDVLVAVGAGHLVGPGSVVALLERRGLKVARVQ